ncbi:aspartyl protease family protein [Symbiopectobacterium purcellii]|uniref:aspartyl protease family protein n=1 Tax=Symbiopectobacterium purcellii TaxID=2871826 RepID=UPI003F839C83
MINNKTLNFLVDTSASVTFIDEKIANTITRPLLSSEIPQNYRQEFSNVSTVSGRLEGHRFSLLKPTAFVIGTKEINDSDIWVSLDLSLLTQSMGTKIDGIIGIDTFRRFNWKVDNDKKKVIISDTLPSASDYQA